MRTRIEVKRQRRGVGQRRLVDLFRVLRQARQRGREIAGFLVGHLEAGEVRRLADHLDGDRPRARQDLRPQDAGQQRRREARRGEDGQELAAIDVGHGVTKLTPALRHPVFGNNTQPRAICDEDPCVVGAVRSARLDRVRDSCHASTSEHRHGARGRHALGRDARRRPSVHRHAEHGPGRARGRPVSQRLRHDAALLAEPGQLPDRPVRAHPRHHRQHGAPQPHAQDVSGGTPARGLSDGILRQVAHGQRRQPASRLQSLGGACPARAKPSTRR